MTENVVSLDGGPVGGDSVAPNMNVVLMLEEMLQMAHAGQLQGLVGVQMLSDRTCPYLAVGKVGGFTMAGSLSALTHTLNDINTSWDED